MNGKPSWIKIQPGKYRLADTDIYVLGPAYSGGWRDWDIHANGAYHSTGYKTMKAAQERAERIAR